VSFDHTLVPTRRLRPPPVQTSTLSVDLGKFLTYCANHFLGPSSDSESGFLRSGLGDCQIPAFRRASTFAKKSAMMTLFASHIEVAPLRRSFAAMRELPIAGFLNNTGFAIQG
jgi:hypothetical protein